jgi:cobalt-zinc-cadmium efflux system protein
VKRYFLPFWLIFGLNSLLSIYSGSATMISETVHSLLDALVITFSMYAMKLVNVKDSRFTYGLHRLEIVSSLANVATVVVGSIIVSLISLLYLIEGMRDQPVILTFASVIAFSLSLLPLSKRDETTRSGVWLHAVQDSLAYLIGILTGVIIIATGWYFIDPVSSLVIVSIMVLTSIKSMKGSLYVIMEGSPLDIEEMESELRKEIPGIHHIHVWDICNHLRVATLHVEEQSNVTLKELDEKRVKIEKLLGERFNINHVTIQFESEAERS